jgi:hypothetical protein
MGKYDKYFAINNGIAVCKAKDCEYKCDFGPSKSTSTLRWHLDRYHKEQAAELKASEEAAQKSKNDSCERLKKQQEALKRILPFPDGGGSAKKPLNLTDPRQPKINKALSTLNILHSA